MKNIFIIIILALAALFAYSIFQRDTLIVTPPDTQETVIIEETPTDQVYAYVDISPEMAKDLIDNNPDLIVIDVSPNYAQGHLPSALSYPVSDGTLQDSLPSLDKDATYLVYCHSDSASIQGAQTLIDAGFTNVYRLIGNYSAWVDAGYPVEM